jgi:ABC-type glycerol-3-phosphate transport system substrate-binding protein
VNLKAREVRVLQEEWAVFRNLGRSTSRFTEQTGIPVEVRLGAIPGFPEEGWTSPADVELWDLTIKSLQSSDPPFDLVGADEVLLLNAARQGLVESIDEYVARDSLSLADFEPAALDAVTYDGRLFGLPYVQVSNVLIYRHDLFGRHAIAVPQTMAELTQAAAAIQEAVRKDQRQEFYGITLRGAPSVGLNFWLLCSSWCPAWGVQWYDEDGRPQLNTSEFVGALQHYVDLLRCSGPPESPQMGFVECMDVYRRGQAAMVIEPANEASITLDMEGETAEGTRTTLVPAGPRGTRHPGLYCPPYAIPANSGAREQAWQLAKYLCSPEQLVDDALQCGLVEVARRSVFTDPRFVARFPPDLVETTRASRPLARIERPITSHGHAVGEIIGEEAAAALSGRQSVPEAASHAQERVEALGRPDWLWAPYREEPRGYAG